MSPSATLLATWAAIYVYAGAFNAMLRVRRPRQREYTAFALMCFGLAVWTLGSALGVDAQTRADATFAVRLQYMGGYAAVGFFFDFAVNLVGARRPRAVIAAYVGCGIAILANAAGLVISDRPAPVPNADWLGYGRAITMTLTPVGYVVAATTAVFSLWGVAELARASRDRPDLRPLLWAVVLPIAAGLYDIASPLVALPSLHATEHAGLLPIAAVSALLMRRFARTSRELEARTAELRRSLGELRATQEELVQKEQLAAVGELSAVIAHEVRNPLAIIKNAHSSLRRRGLSPADRGVLLDILDEEVDRLARLTRDLLAYARPVTPRGQPVDLRALVWDSVDRAVEAAPAPVGVTHEDVALPRIDGDPELLAQAIRNVVDNAVSAMQDGGRLTVRGREVKVDGAPAVLLEIEDDGAGMDPGTLAKATSPFFTTRPAGTGLGLPIVERVVRSHGGTLEIDSAFGRGTTVRIVLPRQAGHVDLRPEEDR